MGKLANIKPEKVFGFFEEISAIPRGSGNMDGISSFCMEFAKKNSLRAVRDEADNVIIYKDASPGYENSEPIILQGHLDMVCQKIDDCSIDFEKDGLELYIDGDYVKARGTTLGADNGIAVAMIMAILADKEAEHPPIEALFTTDEETGMCGAVALDASLLKGKRLINLDAEEQELLTVSCAGGCDLKMKLCAKREKFSGTKVTITLAGLAGGHSGIAIDKGRVNADILAGRVLNYLKGVSDFEIISIDGGDKGNAIPLCCTIQLAVSDACEFVRETEQYLSLIKKEIAERERNFAPVVIAGDSGEYDVIDTVSRDKLIYALLCAPNGVLEMSAGVEGLVETSLNLGILKTQADEILLHFTLRSNKKTALDFLEQRLSIFAKTAGFECETSGHYPPWEFRENSPMQELYKKTFYEKYGYEPIVVAIHAGLECGLFASKINDIDCIAIGPDTKDVHTVNERLSISSTGAVFELVTELLKKCK